MGAQLQDLRGNGQELGLPPYLFETTALPPAQTTTARNQASAPRARTAAPVPQPPETTRPITMTSKMGCGKPAKDPLDKIHAIEGSLHIIPSGSALVYAHYEGKMYDPTATAAEKEAELNGILYGEECSNAERDHEDAVWEQLTKNAAAVEGFHEERFWEHQNEIAIARAEAKAEALRQERLADAYQNGTLVEAGETSYISHNGSCVIPPEDSPLAESGSLLTPSNFGDTGSSEFFASLNDDTGGFSFAQMSGLNSDTPLFDENGDLTEKPAGFSLSPSSALFGANALDTTGLGTKAPPANDASFAQGVGKDFKGFGDTDAPVTSFADSLDTLEKPAAAPAATTAAPAQASVKPQVAPAPALRFG